MKFTKLVKLKIPLLIHNPRMVFYWAYKISNLFKPNALNNGERYDPNILGRFGVNNPDQAARYEFARTLISQNNSVIDIACGTGYGTALLADAAREVTGVDLSITAIKYAKHHYQVRPNTAFAQSDIFSYQGKADIVVSFETIEHVGRPIQETLEKLVSFATQLVICSVPYRESTGANQHHVQFDLAESDFDFLKTKYNIEFLYQASDGVIHRQRHNQTVTMVIKIKL